MPGPSVVIPACLPPAASSLRGPSQNRIYWILQEVFKVSFDDSPAFSAFHDASELCPMIGPLASSSLWYPNMLVSAHPLKSQLQSPFSSCHREAAKFRHSRLEPSCQTSRSKYLLLSMDLGRISHSSRVGSNGFFTAQSS